MNRACRILVALTLLAGFAAGLCGCRSDGGSSRAQEPPQTQKLRQDKKGACGASPKKVGAAKPSHKPHQG